MFTLQKFIKAFTFASCLFILVLNFSHFSNAGTWKDDFNDGMLDGWTRPSDKVKDKNWHSTWKSQDGVLDVIIHSDSSNIDFLQLTAFPISSSSLTVEVTILLEEGSTDSFGMALGIPIEDGTYIGQFHTFTRTSSFGLSIAPDGRFNLLDFGAGDQKRYPCIPSGQCMKVVFESGIFRVFSQDTLLLEFVDENYPKIELVGIFAWSIRNEIHGVMDNFVISGPGIPDGPPYAVHPKGKIAVAWGRLKRP